MCMCTAMRLIHCQQLDWSGAMLSRMREPASLVGLFVVAATKYSLAAILPEENIPDLSRQWTGNCAVLNGMVCGRDINRYCEQETGWCLKCGVYCSEEHYDDNMCRKVCPAWYAQHNPPSTTPSSTTLNGTEVEQTTQADNSLGLAQTLEGLVTQLVKTTSPNVSDDDSHKLYYLAILLFLGIIIVVGVMVFCEIKKYKRRGRSVFLNVIYQQPKITDTAQIPPDTDDLESIQDNTRGPIRQPEQDATTFSDKISSDPPPSPTVPLVPQTASSVANTPSPDTNMSARSKGTDHYSVQSEQK